MSIFNSLGSNYKFSHLSHLIFGFNPFGEQKLIEALEDHFSANALLTYKGREALYLALTQLDLEKGSLVAVNGYTCFAVYDAINRAKLKPVFLDIRKNELNFDSQSLQEAIKEQKISAVIIQNTLGTPSDANTIEDICRDEGIPLIEDLAHSVGMKYTDGRSAGEAGQSVALSFSQDKVVDAVSGGALLYRGKLDIGPRKRVGYWQFLKDYYYMPNTWYIRTLYSVQFGKVHNAILKKLKLMPRPMDGEANDVRKPDLWHANLALRRFSELDADLKHRQRISKIYRAELPSDVQLKHFDESIYLRFPLQVSEPASLIKHLKKADIHVSDTWYEATISPLRCMKDTSYKAGECPNAEDVASKMVNLPTHINIDVEDAYNICKKVNKWLSNQEK